MNRTITIRLNAVDEANIVTIAEAMRKGRHPFVTRSDAIRLAIKSAAEAAFRGTIGAPNVPSKQPEGAR